MVNWKFLNVYSNRIVLLVLLLQTQTNFAQIVYDDYLEIKTSNEFQYKAISLEGQGVLIMVSTPSLPKDETIVSYTLLDNDLNVRSQSDLVYDSQVYYNGIKVDSGVAVLFFTNNKGDCLFEKIDLISAIRSQFMLSLQETGDLVFSDLSLDNPYIIRKHTGCHYAITQFDLESKIFTTQNFDVCEVSKPMNIIDCKIDKSGKKFLILFKGMNDSKCDIYLMRKFIGSSSQELIELTEDDSNDAIAYPYVDCKFDGDDVILISNTKGVIYRNMPIIYRQQMGFVYKRFRNGRLNREKKHTTISFENYSELLKGIPLKGIITNGGYRTSVIPGISDGKLIVRPNGHSLLIGYVFFDPSTYRLPPSDYKGRLYQIVINLNENGSVVWDRQIQIPLVKSDKKFNDNHLNIVYADIDSAAYTGILNYRNSKLFFHELNEEGKVFQRNSNRVILKYHPKDKIKFSNSKIIYLYDRTFLHYGIRQIKNKSRILPSSKYLYFAGTFKL